MLTPSRRHFLKTLLALPAAGIAVSWTLPTSARAAVALPALTHDQMNQITLRQLAPAIEDLYFRDAPILAHLRDRSVRTVAGRPVTSPVRAR